MYKKISPFEKIKLKIENQTITCGNIISECLSNIKSTHHLNAYLSVYEKEAIEIAKSIDQKIREKKASNTLAGMVVGSKDVFSHKNHPLHAASKILEGFEAQYNATVIQKLLDADANIVGRLNCDEFAMGSTNEYSFHGPVKNAYDITRVPGGSSGGSAVAVQTHTCHVALGSDTGGSVRQPAAFCGIIGLKPTYGRISRYGLVAYASSFDTVGLFAQSTSDCAHALEVIAGHDPCDNTSSTQPVPKYTNTLQYNNQSIKIAWLEETLSHPALQPDIKINTIATLEKLKKHGHVIDDAHFPLLPYSLPTYYMLTTSEASTNLACYDGIRYGYRSKEVKDLKNLYLETRSEGFGPEVQRRILLGTFILSSKNYEAYFIKAQKVRRLIKNSLDAILKDHDFIILPTTPNTALELATKERDPVSTYLEDLYTVPASVAGLPAISIPNGVDEKGLPIGLQIISGAFKEHELLSFAQYLIENEIVAPSIHS